MCKIKLICYYHYRDVKRSIYLSNRCKEISFSLGVIAIKEINRVMH